MATLGARGSLIREPNSGLRIRIFKGAGITDVIKVR